MKNIFLGLIFWKWIPAFAGMTMLVFLPQASFGAAACNQQLDADSNAFFQQQAQERGAFIKANEDLIAKQDLLGKWLLDHKRNDQDPSMPPDLTPQEASIFAAFKQKQQSDKDAFFQKQAPARQNCL